MAITCNICTYKLIKCKYYTIIYLEVQSMGELKDLRIEKMIQQEVAELVRITY